MKTNKKIYEGTKADEVYEMLQEYHKINGYFPSQREISDELFIPLTTVQYYLTKLEKQKSIRRIKGKSRVYEIL